MKNFNEIKHWKVFLQIKQLCWGGKDNVQENFGDDLHNCLFALAQFNNESRYNEEMFQKWENDINSLKLIIDKADNKELGLNAKKWLEELKILFENIKLNILKKYNKQLKIKLYNFYIEWFDRIYKSVDSDLLTDENKKLLEDLKIKIENKKLEILEKYIEGIKKNQFPSYFNKFEEMSKSTDSNLLTYENKKLLKKLREEFEAVNKNE